MTLGQAIALGIIQGLTEFLPVSSSGHLVIAQSLLGIKQPGMTFEVLVHFATLLAILVAFRKELAQMALAAGRLPLLTIRGQLGAALRDDGHVRLLAILALASVPAGVVGVLLRDALSALFQEARIAAAMLLITGALLWISDKMQGGSTSLPEVRASQGLMVGVAQAAAILPGISRSGATISVALLAGLSREAAAKFSFLLAVPAILGASFLEVRDMLAGGVGLAGSVLAAGAVSAAVSGYAAIRVLLKFVQAGRLRVFAYYTWLVGALVLLLGG